MGKKIDRFVFTCILAAALFFCFHAVFENSVLAILFSLTLCFLICRIFKQIRKRFKSTKWYRKRYFKQKAGGALMRLACMDAEQAASSISSLLERAYQNDAEIILEQLFPSTSLPSGRIFEIWKSHRHLEKLIVCTTGKCEADARILSSTLTSPKLAIMDAVTLSSLISEYPEEFFKETTRTKRRILRLSQISSMIFNRRNIPKSLLFSFFMGIMYILSANAWYLITSMFLLFCVFVSLHQVPRPRKLF